MIKYILSFLCGVIICFIFVCFMGNKVTTNSITKSISVDTVHIDTIYIERDIIPVSFLGVGTLDATTSPIPIKTDTSGKIYVSSAGTCSLIKSNDISTEDSFLLLCSDISSLDKYILPDFIVSFDTVVNRDTFHLRYEFPSNLFSFDFLPHKDSVMFQQLTISHTITNTKTNWFSTILISTRVGVIGYFVGKSSIRN